MFTDYSKMAGPIFKILFLFERVFFTGGPMVRRPGSDDGILEKLRELFKFRTLFYVDDTITVGPNVTVGGTYGY